MSFEQNAAVMNQQLKHKKLVFELSIKKHTTPASKLHASDLPGVCVIRSEGKTADALAVEDVSGMTNFTAAADATGIFQVILVGSELGSIGKVLKVQVAEKTTAGVSAPVVQILGDNSGLTAEGNIAFEVDTATDLAADTTTTVKFVVELDYELSE
jgi:hypothetical protein